MEPVSTLYEAGTKRRGKKNGETLEVFHHGSPSRRSRAICGIGSSCLRRSPDWQNVRSHHVLPFYRASSGAKRLNGQIPPRCQMTAKCLPVMLTGSVFLESTSSRLQLTLDVFTRGDKLELRKEPLTLISVTGEEREHSSRLLLTAVSLFSSHKYSDVGIVARRGQKRRTEQPP